MYIKRFSFNLSMKKQMFILFIFLLLIIIPVQAHDINYDNPDDIWKCGSKEGYEQEKCFERFAEKGGNISLCQSMDRKACIETYGKDTGDFEYCNNIDLAKECSTIESACIKAYALKSKKESDCELLLTYCKQPNWQPGDYDYAFYKECKKEFTTVSTEERECYNQKDSIGCLRKLAISKNDLSICYSIIPESLIGFPGSNLHDECLLEFARSKKDAKVCDKIKTNLEPTNYRDECYSHFSYLTQDSSLCAKIENELWKESCYERSKPSAELITTAPNIALRYFLFFVVITSLTVFGILITRKSYYFKGITYGLIFGYIVVILFGILKFDPRNISSTFIQYLFFTLRDLPIIALLYGSFGLLLFAAAALQMISPAIAYIVNSGIIYLLGYSLIGFVFGLLYRLFEKYVNKKFAIFAVLVLIIFFWILFALNPHLLEIRMG